MGVRAGGGETDVLTLGTFARSTSRIIAGVAMMRPRPDVPLRERERGRASEPGGNGSGRGTSSDAFLDGSL